MADLTTLTDTELRAVARDRVETIGWALSFGPELPLPVWDGIVARANTALDVEQERRDQASIDRATAKSLAALRQEGAIQ